MFRNLKEYDLIKTEEIKDIKSTGTLLRHVKSGARIFLVENDDENKVFDICFRTPPADSTGVAHILEHSVLCGSRLFPSKDPFVELAKGSLNTFLNAMTYPDKTMYPVASCNTQDFCNLMHVYMDAVFFPNIYEKEEIFRQEGWSYVLEHAEDEVTYNGVVYNEMKGVFSSPDDVLEREIMNSLFPDTPYGIESGGDPKVIPELTYEDFLEFHKRYYHPSNSYIYLYGNLDMEERLRFLDQEYLSKFDAIEVDSEIAMQQPFEQTVELVKSYSISNTDEEKDNTFLAYNLVCGDVLDVNLSGAMSIIEYVLLSAPGAPLKQALLDAGLGKDIEGGYDSGIRQPYFSIVAKYTNPREKERFLKVIHDTLREQADQGLEEKALLAAINNLEFKFREADYGHYPKGLMYGIDAFDSWLYDENAPFDYLRQLDVCRFLKEKVGTGYYEELIRTYLLDNPHSSVIIMVPEKGLTAKEDAKVREHLAAYKATLSDAQIRELTERTAKLRAFQETPSTEEELEKIPLLKLEEIGKKAASIYNTEYSVNESLLLHHDIDTNGIAYLQLLFDLKKVPQELLGYVGILKGVLGVVDTANYGYRELCNEINIHSGGIYPTVNIYSDLKETGNYSSKFEMKAKVLYEQLDFAFSMIEEILLTSVLDDEKRLYEIIARMKSRLQMRLTSAGHSTAATRAMSYFSGGAAFNDEIGGIAFYKLIESLEEHFQEKKEELITNLKKLMQLIFCKENLMISVTCEKEVLQTVMDKVALFQNKLPAQAAEAETKAAPYVPMKKNEGFETSSQVQYVAMAGNYRKAGFSYTGALRILKVIMGYEYLWTNIRVQGGAYGCMSGFGRTGDSYFVSYRDPNLEKTLDVYRGVTEYVKNFEVSDRDMCKYIIGTISEMDTPMNPAAKGQQSLAAYLGRLTEEDLQRERDEVLSATQESIRALAPLMEAIVDGENICVIGNEEKIEAESALFMERKPLIG